MEYKTIIQLLLETFPDFRLSMTGEEDLLELPHCVFDMFLVPFVEKLCREEQKEELINIGAFFESMETCTDKKVKELLNVSFLEPFILGGSDKEIAYLEGYLKKQTLKDFRYWLRRSRNG